MLLTETTCSGNYKGQGEDNLAASYLLTQCHFYHEQKVLRGLGKKKGGEKKEVRSQSPE